MILLRCIVTLFFSTTCFGFSYEPRSGWLVFLSKVKYTISNATVIVTYEILYNMYKKYEVKLIPLYNKHTIYMMKSTHHIPKKHSTSIQKCLNIVILY
jgi:hypothetical protein